MRIRIKKISLIMNEKDNIDNGKVIIDNEKYINDNERHWQKVKLLSLVKVKKKKKNTLVEGK